MIFSLTTGANVSPTQEMAQPVSASGATLWATSDATVTVEPGVWALTSVDGRTFLGWATTETADNIIFVCPVSGTVLIHVPIGTTVLHYRCDNSLTRAFLRKVQENSRTTLGTTVVGPDLPAAGDIYNLYDLYKVRDNLAGTYTQRDNVNMARTNPASKPAAWDSTLYYSTGDMCTCEVGGVERTYFAKINHSGFTPEAATNTYWRMAWVTADGWLPIGTVAAPFTGSFTGTGYTLSNMVIVRATTDYVGLFGKCTTGTLTGIALVGGSVTGQTNTGFLAGNSDSTITTCYATGTVTGTAYTGGLVGYATGAIGGTSYATGNVVGTAAIGGLVGASTGSVTDSYATGSVDSSADYAGGLAGQSATGAITSCYATGAVTVVGTYAGGLVGWNLSSAIVTSYATGTVTGRQYTGGLVGYSSGAITSCYAKIGAVSGTSYVGGLVGNSTAAITKSYAEGAVTGTTELIGGFVGQSSSTISKCYSTGAVVSGIASDAVGGFVGYAQTGTVTDCYARGAITGITRAGGFVGLNGALATIANCYSTGAVTGTDGFGTGIGTFTLCYWDTTTSGQATSDGGTGFVTAKMVYDYETADPQPPANAAYPYFGWSFPAVWQHGTTGQYPSLVGV